MNDNVLYHPLSGFAVDTLRLKAALVSPWPDGAQMTVFVGSPAVVGSITIFCKPTAPVPVLPGSIPKNVVFYFPSSGSPRCSVAPAICRANPDCLYAMVLSYQYPWERTAVRGKGSEDATRSQPRPRRTAISADVNRAVRARAHIACRSLQCFPPRKKLSVE